MTLFASLATSPRSRRSGRSTSTRPIACPIGSSVAVRVAGARELWIRPGPATCATNAGRSAFAFFLKQWGTYRSNPLVQEDGLPLADAQDRDPRTNGKGGALLDGRLHRDFPGEQAIVRARVPIVLAR